MNSAFFWEIYFLALSNYFLNESGNHLFNNLGSLITWAPIMGYRVITRAKRGSATLRRLAPITKVYRYGQVCVCVCEVGDRNRSVFFVFLCVKTKRLTTVHRYAASNTITVIAGHVRSTDTLHPNHH